MVIKLPHGSVVTLNRVVAGVDPYKYDEDDTPKYIKHGVYGINESYLFVFHCKETNVDDPSTIKGLDDGQATEVNATAISRNGLAETELIDKMMEAKAAPALTLGRLSD